MCRKNRQNWHGIDNYIHQEFLQNTLQKYQWILTSARVSKDTKFGFIMVVYEKTLFNILKCLEEIRKYMWKIILQKNILYLGDPNYVLSFAH